MIITIIIIIMMMMIVIRWCGEELGVFGYGCRWELWGVHGGRVQGHKLGQSVWDTRKTYVGIIGLKRIRFLLCKSFPHYGNLLFRGKKLRLRLF